MHRTARHWVRRTLIVVSAAGVQTGCGDQTASIPGQRFAAAKPPAAANEDRIADLNGCDQLRAPQGSKLVVRAIGKGVQMYSWTGTKWNFVAPSATLFADAGGNRVIGIHFAGPTWQSNNGGRTVGTALQHCTPDERSIPWLLLGAKSEGPGIFHDVTSIQRLNTVGGNAPDTAGTFVGEMANVPYTADYLFYR